MKHKQVSGPLVVCLLATIIFNGCSFPKFSNHALNDLPVNSETSNFSGSNSQPMTEEQFLVQAQAIGLTIEDAKSLAALGRSWEEIIQMSYEEAQEVLSEAKQLHEQFNLHELGLQLFEYFRTNPAACCILGEEPDIEEEEIAAFAIQQILTENPTGFDFENGVSKQAFDDVCTKYFGKTLTNYNNTKIRTLPTGNIISTGWSPSSFDFVLKEYTQQSDGRYTAVFYLINAPREETAKPYEAFDTILNDIAHEDVNGYGEIFLLQMEFKMIGTSDDGMYLKFYDVQGLGKASF